MAFLVSDQLFEQVLRDVIAHLLAMVARLDIEGGGVMLGGEVGVAVQDRLLIALMPNKPS